MVCEHLQRLYQLCLDQKIRLSGSDLTKQRRLSVGWLFARVVWRRVRTMLGFG